MVTCPVGVLVKRLRRGNPPRRYGLRLHGREHELVLEEKALCCGGRRRRLFREEEEGRHTPSNVRPGLLEAEYGSMRHFHGKWPLSQEPWKLGRKCIWKPWLIRQQGDTWRTGIIGSTYLHSV